MSDRTTPVILSACRTPIGRYLGGLQAGAASGQLIATSELDLRPAQIPAAEYEELARWARQVDDIEAREVRLRLDGRSEPRN